MFCKDISADTDKIKNMNAIVLSYVGDAVHTLYVRQMLALSSNERAHALHEKSISLVNAEAQARALEKIESLLSEEELAIYHRGRNCKNASSSKNAKIVDYRKATGFEAVIGYLYLCGFEERLNELLKASLEESL